jgi:hypothetical protein
MRRSLLALALLSACGGSRTIPEDGPRPSVPATDDAGFVAPASSNDSGTTLATDLPFFDADPAKLTFDELAKSLGVSIDPAALDSEGMGYVVLPRSGSKDPAPLTADVDRLSGSYGWDVYHSRRRTPEEARRQRLSSFTVHFAGGRTAREALLARRFGTAKSAREPGDPKATSSATDYRVYGPYFVATGPDERFRLTWYAKAPDWSLTIDAASRRQALANLAQALLRITTEAELDAAGRAAPRDAGLLPTGRLNPGDFWLELAPAMPAKALFQALGIEGPLALVSHDVHMSHWKIQKKSNGARLDALAIGGWTLEIAIDGRPSGPRAPTKGPFPVYELGDADVVRSFAIAR